MTLPPSLISADAGMPTPANHRSGVLFAEASGPVSAFPAHPHRADLVAETHARPPLPIDAPALCTLLLFHSGESGAEADRRHLEQLCTLFGAHLPGDDPHHALISFGAAVLKWERHTEYSAYIFVERYDRHGATAPIEQRLPDSWKAEAPGQLLVAMRLYIDKPTDRIWSAQPTTLLLDRERLSAITANGGTATIWTDFSVYPDGFSRLLVCDHGEDPNRLGRLVQRLIEIETYRTLALLAWPEVQSVGPRLGQMDEALTGLVERLNQADASIQASLLDQLTDLAARSERLAASSQFRFSAAKAYYAIVLRRIDELREERVEGCQRFSTFIERRLGPAMRTVQAIQDRQHDVADRISRASQLLRARVELELERQNQRLLTSMNQRVTLQYRLQQTVEGLSVVAIGYYALSILAAIAEGLPIEKLGWDSHGVKAALAPFVLAGAWLGLRQAKRHLHRGQADPL